MWRRLLIVAFVAMALLGLASPSYESALVAEAHADDEVGCCPCDDDGDDDDGCCTSAACACTHANLVAPDPAERPRARPVGLLPSWSLACQQRARDRSSAPPTPPPIG